MNDNLDLIFIFSFLIGTLLAIGWIIFRICKKPVHVQWCKVGANIVSLMLGTISIAFLAVVGSLIGPWTAITVGVCLFISYEA